MKMIRIDRHRPERVEGQSSFARWNASQRFDKTEEGIVMASQEIEALSQALARLPGLGPRSARRAVLHLMKRRESALEPLLLALRKVSDNLSTCSTCGNVDTSDPCAVCRDPRRDDKMLCVVEEVADLWALDRSRLFPGRYHVLGGRL